MIIKNTYSNDVPNFTIFFIVVQGNVTVKVSNGTFIRSTCKFKLLLHASTEGDKNLGSPNLSNSVLMDGDKIDFVVLWAKARMLNVIFCTCFY